MAKKKRATAEAAQDVFPIQLYVGDVMEDDTGRAEIVMQPTAGPTGKTTHA